MGAICGAATVYGNYFHAIDIFEGGRGVRTVGGATSTAGLFGTYAVRLHQTLRVFCANLIISLGRLHD